MNQLWAQLASNASPHTGFVKIRYSDTSLCPLYLGLIGIHNLRCLLIRVPFRVANSVQVERNLKGIKIEKIAENADFILLSLCLQDHNFEDIFNTLLGDIITHVIDVSDSQLVLRQFLNRVDKWHALLEKAISNGLTSEEQRGLFGELFLLRKLLNVFPEAESPLRAWVGPEKAIRDFQYGEVAIEVKTSHGNNHQRIHISNERQLDTSTLEHLYLFHLSMETQQLAGESLNELVDSILLILQDNFKLHSHFQLKLAQAGYLPAHRELYNTKGYIIRSEAYYEVKSTFPRIEENDLRHGVGDVRYSIIISNCDSYQTNELTVYQKLSQAW
ncbi:PD-(D/E)XK motif protein [Pontibacter fetidus]|uniref:PD-(D/E)XK motif protein n=1 Tax=Pontibacter fetidus TaxID=2700082 RepID=A0A6B2HB90_9BACT|nr:PD-(D/E)XK motif protein [Pontibacter fetidus]NDK57690.1 PD-(D/E)XK motif protein [Pontibacter fetidus]